MTNDKFAYTFPELAQKLAQKAEATIQYLALEGKVVGKNFETGNVQGEEGKSLVIALEDISRSSGSISAGTWKDFASSESGDLLELWAKNRCSGNKGEASKQVCSWLGLALFKDKMSSNEIRHKTIVKSPISLKKPIKHEDSPVLAPGNSEYIGRFHSRLLKHEKALSYLSERNIDQVTVDKFKLGLSEPYRHDGELKTDQYLQYPIMGEDGVLRKKNGMIHIPDVSLPIDGAKYILKGGAAYAYYNGMLTFEHQYLIIVEGHKDLWALDTFLRDTRYANVISIITPNNGANSVPDEFYDNQFFKRFKKVFCAYDSDKAGDDNAINIAKMMDETLYRVRIPNTFLPVGHDKPDGADLTDFIKTSPTISQFEDLLRNAFDALTFNKIDAQEMSKFYKLSAGQYEYNAFDPNISFHNGHLYYPMRVHIVSVDPETEEKYEYMDTVVIRSDRKKLTLRHSPVPKGMDKAKQILRLSDGSIVSSPPRVNEYSTWNWNHAVKWLNGDYKIPSTKALFEDIRTHLTNSVYLTSKEDYTLLTLTVMASYVQNIFEAVPYILLNGPAGSGKSELGNAMSNTAANANVVGASSAATLSREFDKTAGFMFIDDLESIGKNTRQESAFSDTQQYLKVGYKRATSIRKVTDPKTGKTHDLNMFGIKLITNTSGVDEILESRMFIIQTRKIPKGMTWSRKPTSQVRLNEVRQGLHAWAFENVEALNSIYQTKYADKANREEEISAPLDVIANFIDDESIKSELAEALLLQAARKGTIETPEDVLAMACKSIIKQGYTEPLVIHLQMELATMIDATHGKDHYGEIAPWERSGWITKTLNNYGIIEQPHAQRTILNGKKLRNVDFTIGFINEQRESIAQPVPIKTDAREFCSSCDGCHYVSVCKMKDAKRSQYYYGAAKNA
jgi:hypothetical protein